jgi:hypothetical protein
MGFLKRRKYATAAEEAMVATTMVCEVDSFPIMVKRSEVESGREELPQSR